MGPLLYHIKEVMFYTPGRIKIHIFVTLRIIWHNFLCALWHAVTTSYLTDYNAFAASAKSLVTRSTRLISRFRRMSDQNTLQKSNVSADDSDDCLWQIASKVRSQISG